MFKYPKIYKTWYTLYYPILAEIEKKINDIDSYMYLIPIPSRREFSFQNIDIHIIHIFNMMNE